MSLFKLLKKLFVAGINIFPFALVFLHLKVENIFVCIFLPPATGCLALTSRIIAPYFSLSLISGIAAQRGLMWDKNNPFDQPFKTGF